MDQLISPPTLAFMSKDELDYFTNNAMNISPQTGSPNDFFQSQEYLDLIGFDEGSSSVLNVLSNENDDSLDTNNTNEINNNNLKSGNIMEAYAGFSFPDATRNDYASFMEANPNALREDWADSFRSRFTDATSQKTSDDYLFKLIPKPKNNTTSTKSNQNYKTNFFGQKVYFDSLTLPIDSNKIDTTKKIEIGSAGFTTSAKITNVTRAKNGAVNYEIEYKNNLGKTETKMISATGKTGMSFNFDYEKYIEENE